MKIAILTQPLGKNYGGILQAYALQNILIRLGHDSVIIDRQDNYPSFKLLLWRLASLVKCFIKKHIKKDPNVLVLNPVAVNYITDRRLAYDYTKIEHFVNDNLVRSKVIRTSSGIRRFLIYSNIDCVIVGSDQVWREDYSPCITDYFGGFLRSDDNIRLISYAASFGLETIPIAQNNQQVCNRLLRSFHSVSVREKTAVDLLYNGWGIDAKLVLDPTLLFEKSFYEKLIEGYIGKRISVFCYLLDDSIEKKRIIRKVSEVLQQEVEHILLYPKNNEGNAGRLESMLDWLYSISNSKYVVTDSYHGCVFAILFNKPFVVIANKKRGIDRFATLLDMLSLSHRMVSSVEQVTTLLFEEDIDYTRVNEILKQRRIESMDFLKRSLSK